MLRAGCEPLADWPDEYRSRIRRVWSAAPPGRRSIARRHRPENKTAREQQQPYQAKNPRIMPSPALCLPDCWPPNTGRTHEIQPRQCLEALKQTLIAAPARGESVDARKQGLYKTANWRRARSCRRCSLNGAASRTCSLRGWHFQEHPETFQTHPRNRMTGAIGRLLAVGHCRRIF